MCGSLILLCVLCEVGIRHGIRQQELNQALITAITLTDVNSAQDLLNQGADPDACDTPQQAISLWRFLRDRFRSMDGVHNGTPALALAVSAVQWPGKDIEGKAKAAVIVKALLDHGAHIDVKDSQGEDMINLAVEPYHNSHLLRMLLRHRGNVKYSGRRGQTSLLERKSPIYHRTPLLTVAGWGSPEEIDLLLSAGATVDFPDDYGQTALMFAVEKGRPENIACLLKYHASVRVKDRDGNTALSLARKNRAGNVVTPFNHEVDDHFWPNIVNMLEKALAQE